MSGENKTLIGFIVVSLVIVVGGIFFFSKPSGQSAPKPVQKELLVRDDSPKVSASGEKAVLVEFGDYQCSACGAYHGLVKDLLESNKASLSFVFRHFPLSQHKNARAASYAAEAAGVQGKYWEMHAKLYENQNSWANLGSPNKVFEDFAKDLGLDVEKFAGDLEGANISSKVDRDYTDGVTLGVNSTPTFYLNGRQLNNPKNLSEFQNFVDQALQNTGN